MNKHLPTALGLFSSHHKLFEDLSAIMRLPEGYTFVKDDVWLWGFPVSGEGPYEIREYDSPDTWLVWLCVGNLALVKDLIPYPLPWITFARDNKLRRYRFETLLARL